MLELRSFSEKKLPFTDQEERVRERESPWEVAFVDQTLLLFSLEYSRKVSAKLLASLIKSSQEDSVQKEPITSEALSLLERRMMWESTLFRELLKRKSKRLMIQKSKRLSTKLQRSRDSSQKRDLEERSCMLSLRRINGLPLRKLMSLTKNCFPSSSRKRRLLTKNLINQRLQQRSQHQSPQPNQPNQQQRLRSRRRHQSQQRLKRPRARNEINIQRIMIQIV